MMRLTAILLIALLAASQAAGQDGCRRPAPVRALSNIRFHTLALSSNWGPAVVQDDCSVLDRASFGKRISFYILPPSDQDDRAAYVLIKSYRSFTTPTWDKIKVSRGDGWHPAGATASNPAKLDAIDDVRFSGTPEKWNEAHSAASAPDAMAQKLGIGWHSYADIDKRLPSTELMAFWQTPAGAFDFQNGTVTNYLIRFPANTTTPVPFYVGFDKKLKEFRLEFYSSIDSLSNQSFRFVFR